MNTTITLFTQLLANATPAEKEEIAKLLGLVADAPKPEKPELVPYKKGNGEIVMTTPAQAAAWTKFKENKKSKEELQASTKAFKWTEELDKIIKSKPSISRKELAVASNGASSGCTREMLRDRKNELGLR